MPYGTPIKKWTTAQLKAKIVGDSQYQAKLVRELILRIRAEEHRPAKKKDHS